MRSYLIAQTKGGCGKTTVTFGLAVEAVRHGLSALVIDGDRAQRSLTSIMEKREADAPALAEIEGGSIADALGDPTVQSYDRVFVDAPPLANLDVRALVRAVDRVLMPVGASPLDVEASGALLDAVRRAERSYAYIINAADRRRSVVEQVRGVIAAAHPVAPIIGDRAEFVTAAGAGLAPGEWNPKGKAAGEITSLWSYVDA